MFVIWIQDEHLCSFGKQQETKSQCQYTPLDEAMIDNRFKHRILTVAKKRFPLVSAIKRDSYPSQSKHRYTIKPANRNSRLQGFGLFFLIGRGFGNKEFWKYNAKPKRSLKFTKITVIYFKEIVQYLPEKLISCPHFERKSFH